ncbi:MAG TPA: extracellular solute-binding protein, partial [Chloroflexota bacterium]|nr:extracellular solute-binding protein [Chloroflexota bacterium]
HHPDVRTIVYRNVPLMQEVGLDGSKEPESWDQLKEWGIKLNKKDWFDFTIAQCSWQGKVYAMTHHPDVRSIVYRNVPLMQEAGLDGSKAPESWDQLKEWGLKMTKRDGARTTQFGWVPMWIQNQWALQFPQANGTVFLDGEARKITFDTPQTVEALDFVVKATDEINGGRDKVVEFDAGQPDKGQQNVYGNAGLGIAIGGNWYLDRIANVSKNEKAMKSQVSMFPGGPSAKGKEFGQYITMHTVIPTESKKPDAGWEFVKHDTGPIGQKHIQWNFGAFDISSIPSVANNPESLKLQPWRKRMHELMVEAKEPSFFPHPGSGDINAAITNVINPFLRGEENPRTTMDALKRDVERLMAQFRV